MATRRNPASVVWAWAKNPHRAKPPMERGLRVAWGLFLGLGIPAGLLAALGPLTEAGIYLEPLRPLWRPWIPELTKPVLGAAVFIVMLGVLLYRGGRSKGFRSGTLAAKAISRNLAEQRPAPAQPRQPVEPIQPVQTAEVVPPPPPPENTPPIEVTQ